MTSVLDSSALLAYLLGEPGSDEVRTQLDSGAMCGAANWSELAQKVRAAGRNWDLARSLLMSFGLTIESVTVDDAEWAAQRWRRGEGLSLADRLCLALARRHDAVAWTADGTWGQSSDVRQIR